MNENHEEKRRREILAGILVLLFLAMELCFAKWVKAAPSPAAGESGEQSENRPVTELQPARVTLCDVQSVNARRRPMRVKQTGVTEDDRKELIFRSVQLDDIPLIEAFQNDGAPKPLLLFLHGLGQTKESLLPALTDFARAGYYAVSMDAFDHGGRTAQVMCDNWAAMLITVADIDQVVEYYASAENVRTEGFVLGGFSMGAIETWAYAQLGIYRPAALLPIAGICELSAWRPLRREHLYTSWLENCGALTRAVCLVQEPFYTREKYETIESLNILDNLDAFSDIPIFCGMGTEDTYFDSGAAQKTVQAIAQAGNDKAVFTAYEGETHRLTPQMISDSIAFLQASAEDRSLADI